MSHNNAYSGKQDHIQSIDPRNQEVLERIAKLEKLIKKVLRHLELDKYKV